MIILYCSSPMPPREIDPDYVGEADAARAAGFCIRHVNFEDLLAGDIAGALRRTPPSVVGEKVLYRGWMMPVERYALLYEALTERNIHLITAPGAYRHCHYMPENYGNIKDLTARTVWRHSSQGLDIDSIMQTLAPLGSGPAIIKDYVKSRKHEWADACFIADAAVRVEVERVTENFLRGQGTDLAEGLVFREFFPLKQLGVDARTGAPISVEYRIFYFDGNRVVVAPHFDTASYEVGDMPDVSVFDQVAKSIPSPFFSMDIARTADGKWIIVELGDGQVAGLPESADVDGFYQQLASALAVGGHLGP